MLLGEKGERKNTHTLSEEGEKFFTEERGTIIYACVRTSVCTFSIAVCPEDEKRREAYNYFTRGKEEKHNIYNSYATAACCLCCKNAYLKGEKQGRTCFLSSFLGKVK